MLARHLLIHVGIVAIAVVVLPQFGVALSTALIVGLMAGCVAMAIRGGHAAHRGTPQRRAEPDRTRAEKPRE